MISKLVLSGFKSFSQYQTLKLGNFSLLLGANASGKSNVGDALRFLHGISRGYTLLEIMNEKRGIGGELIWKGIRGGLKEIYHNIQRNNSDKTLDVFSLIVKILTQNPERVLDYDVCIMIEPNKNPSIVIESLELDANEIYRFSPESTDELKKTIQLNENETIEVRILEGRSAELNVSKERPILTQMTEDLDEKLLKYALATQIKKRMKGNDGKVTLSSGLTLHIMGKEESLWLENSRYLKQTLSVLQSMRFFDLNPEAMRVPSLTGQTVLGEQGENLSSVLHAIHEQKDDTEANLLEWLGALTPTDATNFKFYIDPYTNKVLAILIESNGQETSLYSASDGTLRFLAILAALFSPTPASLYFFEEIENGIHPSRLYLLVELLEERAKSGIQIIATTHSPQLLSLVSQTTLENSSLIYRAGDHHSSQIMPILEIPNIKEILEKQDIAKLYSTGWFEDVMEFMQEDSQ